MIRSVSISLVLTLLAGVRMACSTTDSGQPVNEDSAGSSGGEMSGGGDGSGVRGTSTGTMTAEPGGDEVDPE